MNTEKTVKHITLLSSIWGLVILAQIYLFPHWDKNVIIAGIFLSTLGLYQFNRIHNK